MGDRGIPASYRHMNGFGSHTYQWTNAAGEAFFVKYHFKTNQGVRSLSAEQAAEQVGKDANSHQTDLLQAIERGVNPSWTLYVQVMPSGRGGGLPLQPVRRDEGLAARRPPAPARRPAWCWTATRTTSSPRSSRPRSRRTTSCPASARPRTRCSRAYFVRVRRRAALPAGHQPHPAPGQRAEGGRRRQLRPRRAARHPVRLAPGQELRAQLVRGPRADRRRPRLAARGARLDGYARGAPAREGRRLLPGGRALPADVGGREGPPGRQHRRMASRRSPATT